VHQIMPRFSVFALLALGLSASAATAQTLFPGAGGSGGEPGIERQCGPSSPDGKTHVGGVIHDLLTTEPVAGVAVAIRRQDSFAGERIAVTDEQGEFVVCELAWNGPSRMEILDEEGKSTVSRVDLARGANWIGTRFVRVVGAASLRGRVSDLSGQPVEGAVVDIEPLGLSTKTGVDGTFRLHGLAGLVTLSVSHPSFGNRTEDVWLEGGFGFEAQIALGPQGAQVPAIVLAGGSDVPSDAPMSRPLSPLAGVAEATAGPANPTRQLGWDRVELGSRVRLTAPGVLVEDGVLTSLEPRSLVVAEGDQGWSLPTESIQSLEVKESSSLRLGLIVGLAGLGTGAILGAKFVSEVGPCTTRPNIINGQQFGEITTCSRVPVGAMAVAVPMAAMGAGAGLVLGKFALRWRPVF
ncbi:MAG: carboxypeptidase regulatory-like domain-containing protein, partial [Longimicrobiales bacterium]